MTLFFKQSTAVVVSFGPFLDKTDGVTEETGLVSALDHGTTGIKLSKNGGALTIRHATVTATTYDAYGNYRVTLDATDTNTLGTLRMSFNEAATCLPVWQDFMVLPANIYDSLVSGSDLIDVSMTQILGTAVSSPATAGILDVNVKNIDNDAASASGTVTFPNATLASTTNITAAAGIAVSSIGANVITAASIAADAITDAKVASDVTIASVTGAVGSVAGNVGGNVVGSVGSVTAEVTANMTKILGTAVSTPATAGILDVNILNIGGSAADLGATPGMLDVRIAEISVGGQVQFQSTQIASVSGAVGSVTGAVGSVTGAVGSVTGNVGGNVTGSVGSVTGLTAANLDVAVSTRLATAGYTAPLDAAGTRTAVGLASANLDTQLADLPTAAENADANWDEARSGHVAAGSFGEGVKVNSIADAAITADSIDYGAIQDDKIHGATYAEMGAKAAQLTWQSLSADYAPAGSLYVADSMGEQMTHLDADVSSAGGGLDAAGVRAAVGLATANLDTQLGTIDDFLDTEVAAIKAKTDLIPASPASTTNITAASGIAVSSIGANVITATSIASNAITSAKIAADAIGASQIAADAIGSSELATSAMTEIVNAIFEESMVSRVNANTAGLALNTAAAVGSQLGPPVGASISADIAAAKADTVSIKAKTDNLPASPASTTNITAATGVTVATNNDKTGYALSSGGIQAIWDALTSALTTVGSIGKRLVDNIDAAISSRSTYAGGDTSGVSTLLSRITGTLAAGTHNAQSGDAYARLGAAGAGLTALGDTRIANLDAAVSTRLATAGYTVPPTAAANATQVRSELTTELGRIDAAISTRLATAGYTAPPSAAANASQVRTELATELAQITLAKKILKNRTQTNPSTGIMTVYDDDGTTPLLTANIYEDVAGTVPYDGSSGVNRRNALA